MAGEYKQGRILINNLLKIIYKIVNIVIENWRGSNLLACFLLTQAVWLQQGTER